ncbi:hypothetical protein CSV77_07550 [Sporosarcina sp. P16b]|uniref:hypothetical protein n=1 Tax=Sporosarcina sp. P16b TaxID=2048261 RepID=UPI000C172BAB|nr:hypothetical protein [Sporosarcina sp. P16b]PIC70766.1 hypothetical protein CSV77_07550 [Sporosarcina sp. P16b]
MTLKIKKIPLLIIISIYLTACGTANTKQTDLSGVDLNDGEKEWYEYELVMPSADFLEPQNFDEIQKNSSAIVIAKTNESLSERKSTVRNNETGHVETFYTDTTIEIIDILEQSSDSEISKGDKVSYREYYALREDNDREYILIYDNYTPLKKGSGYILVMTKSEENNELYYNEAWNLAKFNIDGTDPYDFLFDPQQSNSLSSNVNESLNGVQQIDKIQKAFSSYSVKKDGNSAYSLNQLFTDKMRFYQELEQKYSEKLNE